MCPSISLNIVADTDLARSVVSAILALNHSNPALAAAGVARFTVPEDLWTMQEVISNLNSYTNGTLGDCYQGLTNKVNLDAYTIIRCGAASFRRRAPQDCRSVPPHPPTAAARGRGGASGPNWGTPGKPAASEVPLAPETRRRPKSCPLLFARFRFNSPRAIVP